ncbi:MAG: cation diffusion facilitator family transporter [Thermoplasmatota archaeon]
MERDESLECVEVHAPLDPDNEDHGHSHGDHASGDRKLVIAALAVTGAVMMAELAGGLLTRSLALVSDSLHMFTHFISLLIALGAMWAASLPRNWTRTFGLFRAEVLAALVNGAGLLVFSVYILYEAYTRLMDRTEVDAGWMLAVAVLGLVANLISAWLLYRAKRRDLNLKGAMAHMLADTISSGAVIMVGLVMLIWPIYELDAAVSVMISILVAVWSYRIIRDSTRILLELTPKDMDLEKVKKRMLEVDGVLDVHDIHAWEITSGMRCMTCHVMISSDALKEDAGQGILSDLRVLLKNDHQVVHTTFQMECSPPDHSGG